MNETLKNIAERYSCRDFKDTPLTDEQVNAIVEAALAAPSARNRQPWHVVVIRDKELIDEFDSEGMRILETEDKEMFEIMTSRGEKLFYNAPCLAIILSDGSKWGMLDSGILCENIAIAAQSLGLGSCIIGMARFPLSGPHGEYYRRHMRFPDGYEFAISIALGAANKTRTPHELDMGKVTYI